MSLTSPASRKLAGNRFRIRYAVLAVAVATALGTLGFHQIEGWSIVDSLYAATQTVTTVGYGDLAPVTLNGRIFATIFMFVGVGVVLYSLTATVQSIVQSELLATFGQRRQLRKMSKLRDHFIICGRARRSHLVKHCSGEQSFIVIERVPKSDGVNRSRCNCPCSRRRLRRNSQRSRGGHARGLAACLPDDADNVYVVLTARDLNSKIHIVARAAEEQAESKLIRAGANRVVAPTIIGGHRMAVALTKPAVGDFIDSITANTLGLALEQLEVSPSSLLVGQKLSGTNIRSELDIVIVSIRRSDGQTLFNPSGEASIEAGDMLIAIGSAESLMKLTAKAKGTREPTTFNQ